MRKLMVYKQGNHWVDLIFDENGNLCYNDKIQLMRILPEPTLRFIRRYAYGNIKIVNAGCWTWKWADEPLTLRSSLDKLERGDQLNDKEVKFAIGELKKIVDILSTLGEKYYLTVKELRGKLHELKRIVELRELRKNI